MILGYDAKRAFQNATGLGNYARDVLRLVHAHDPGARLLAYAARPPQRRWTFPEDRFEVRGPRGLAGRAFPALWRQAGIAAAARRDGVEVFHGLSAELPLGIERGGVASVVTVHDLVFERLPELYAAPDRAIYAWKTRSAAARADLVVAISEQTARDLVELYRVPERKIRVVYQGCHRAFQEPPPPPEADAEVARRHGLAEPYLLSVGTVERRKNLLSTARALRGLPEEVGLAVVGRETPYAAEVRAYAAAHGLERRIRFLSGVGLADLPALYRRALALVYPSFYEGFGIPIVEALFSGTPVVTSRGGCFAEAAGPGAAFVDPGDPAELAAVLAELVASPARRAELSARGREHAERFRDPAVAAALLAVYREARAARAGLSPRSAAL